MLILKTSSFLRHEKQEMGTKIPQQSSSRPWLHAAVTIITKVTEKRRTKSGGPNPDPDRRPYAVKRQQPRVQSYFSLLSGLLMQTLYDIYIMHQKTVFFNSFYKLPQEITSIELIPFF